MNQAINAYYSITASSEFREVERLREKVRHDEAQALYHAEQRGIQKGASERSIEWNALTKRLPIEDIIDITGLTREEAEHLSTNS